MNRKWLALVLLAGGTALASAAAPLQFTNITVKLFPGLTNRLNAVAYGGSSNFLAVGNNQAYVIGNFTPLLPWFTSANWATNLITSNSSRAGSNLTSVASSGKLFMASGDNNWVYFATNIFSPSGLNWPSNHAKVFNNNAIGAGAAYNGGNFVVVGTAPEIGYTNTPTGTNWPLAALTNLSFAESYRGVTPYGTNGFAACGVFGVVRTATAANNFWQTNHGGIGQPDFFSIANDGANTLVCVGASNATATVNGIIQVSTNHGATWQTAYFNAATNTPLNGVAYTGSGFIAVGKGGQILTSTNGLVWTIIPVSWLNNIPASPLDLYGVNFAGGGYMHDVGEIVGANGNVIVVAPPPPTNTSLGNKWICVGVTDTIWVGTNTSLPANTLQVTNAWGTNIVVVDWFKSDKTPVTPADGTVFITNGMFSFTPTFITDNSDNYTNTYYAQARDLRTGFINTNWTALTLTNFMRPTAAMVTTNTICNGDPNPTPIYAQLAGNGPWKVYWTDGFSYFTNTVGGSGIVYASNPYIAEIDLPNSVFDPTNVFANLPTNHYYWIWKLTDRDFPTDDPTNLNPTGINWPGDFSGTNLVTVNPRPTATMPDYSGTNCNVFTPYTFTNTLTGIGPWTVIWNDGYTQTTTTNLGSPAILTRTVVPSDQYLNTFSNNVYFVTVVSNADTCLGNLPGDIKGTSTVRINPRPTATMPDYSGTNCNLFTAYTFTNTLTGIGPWTVIWNDGYTQTITTNLDSPAILTRTVVPSDPSLNTFSNNVFFVTVVSNADTCLGNQPGDISGTSTVRINPRPTVSVVTTNTICNGDSAVLQAILTGIGSWTVTWTDGFTNFTEVVGGSVDGPYTNNLTIPNSAFNPTNEFLNAITNHTYWVTALSDNNCSAGAGDISGVASISVNPRPTATLVTTNTICNGDATVLQANLTGLGPWTVLWTDGFTNYTQTVSINAAGPYTNLLTIPNGVFNPTNIFLNAATNHHYWVTSLSDSNCNAWAGDISGTSLVTVNPRPTASVVTTNAICNGGSTLLQANLTGIGPWMVTWSDGFEQTTNASPALRVVSPADNFPDLATNYFFTVTTVSNADSCIGNQPGDLAGIGQITVNPRPTATVLSITNTICNGDTTILQADLHGIGPWTVKWSDGLVQTTNGTPVLRTANPANPLLNLATNFDYTIISVSNLDSCVGNQPGDLSGLAVVTVNPRPTATLVTTNTICNGSSTVLQANLTGIGPWTVTWSDGNIQSVGSSTALYSVSPTNLFLNVAVTNLYWVTSVSNADTCLGNLPGDIKGTNKVIVNPRPTATIIQVTNSYYQLLTFDDLPVPSGSNSASGIPDGYGGLNWLNLDVTDAFLDNVGIGFSVAAVSTNNICILTASGGIVTGAAPFTLVSGYLTSGDLSAAEVVALGYTNGNLVYSNSYTLSTNGPVFVSFNYSNVDVVEFTNYTGANYLLMDNLTVQRTGPTEEICNGSLAMLQASLTGIGPWNVKWSDGYVQSTNGSPAIHFVNPTNVLLNQTTNFYYSVTSVSNADTCLGNQPGDLTGTASVTVSPRPTAFVYGSTNFTVGSNELVTATISADLTGFGPWAVTWSDGVAQTYTNSPAVRSVTTNLNLGVTSFTNYVYQRFRSANPNGNSTNDPLDNTTSAGSMPLPDRDTPLITNATLIGTLVAAGNVNVNVHNNQWQLYATNKSYGSGSSTRYWNYFLVHTNSSTNTSPLVSTTFRYTVTNLTDATSCRADTNDLSGFANILLSVKSTVDISTPGSTNICLNDPILVVATFTGTAPWTNIWSDGTTNIVIGANNPYSVVVIPTNTGWFNYTITNIVDGAGGVSTNVTGGIAVYVNPLPTGVPPVSNGDQTNCAGLPNAPLTVNYEGAGVVNWYDANTNQVASGTNSFTPPDSDPGVYTYYAAEANSSGCHGTLVAVHLVLLDCSNPPIITWGGTNGVGTVQWIGNLTLQSTTNLLPPNWIDVVTGSGVTNIWSWTNGVPPWTNPYYFFRLNTN